MKRAALSLLLAFAAGAAGPAYATIDNTATATGTPVRGTLATPPSDTVNVAVEVAAPSMTLEKTATVNDDNGNGRTDAGDTIDYQFTIRNAGNVTLTNISVSDPMPGLTISGSPLASLAPGATDTSITGSYTITQADVDAGTVSNQATATGSSPGNTDDQTAVSDDDNGATDSSGDGDPSNDPTKASITGAPSMTLEKTATVNDDNSNGRTDAGDTIDYQFTIRNTGNVTLTNISVSDPMPGLTISGSPLAGLAPGATDTSITGTYTITQADVDAGTVSNQATAKGSSPGNTDDQTAVSDNDNDATNGTSPTDTPITGAPSMTLEKTATVNDDNGNGRTDAGDTISYQFTIRNTGNVTLTNISVSDPMPGLTISGSPLASLAPGATDTSITGTYTITQADVDAGTVSNQATATGSSPGNTDDQTAVSDDDNGATDSSGDGDPSNDPTKASITGAPSMTLEKTATVNDDNSNGRTDAGDTISYQFTIRNTGNVTLTNISVSDPMPGLTISGSPLASLAPGATDTSITGTYTITQADVDAGTVSNQATAKGSSPGNTDDQTAMSDNDNDATNGTGPTDTPITGAPSMTLGKTATVNDDNSNGRTDAGDTISYRFTIRNTGNVTLTNISVSDPMPGLTISGSPLASLAPGATDTSITGTYTITQADVDAGTVSNQATAKGSSPGNTDDQTAMSDNDNDATNGTGPTDTPITGAPGMTVVKAGRSVDFTRAGDQVEFTITISNTGNVTLLNVNPVDMTADAVTCPSGSPVPALQPGGQEICIATHTVSDADMADGKVSDAVDVFAGLPGGGSFGPVGDTAIIDVRMATITGYVFTDANGNGIYDAGADPVHADYTVELVDADGNVVKSVTTGSDGAYVFTGVIPGRNYSIVFRDKAGTAVGGIPNMEMAPGENRADQDMPIDPSGVVYDSVTGSPVSGARVTMTDAGGNALPSACFVDPAQQNQVTTADGGYRFDIFPGANAACPTTETEYRITVQAPAGYASTPSANHPPLSGPLDITACVFDAVPGGACQPAAEATPPSGPATLPYLLALLMQSGDPNVIHNHIPLDPFASTGNVSITKVAASPTLRRGERMGYTIRVTNKSADDAGQVRIVDRTPPGFAYVDGTARVNGTAVTPTVSAARIDFGLQPLGPNATIEITLSLQSLASAGPGEYVNRADVTDPSGRALAPTAKATVELTAEPVFDCSDVIGKVFDDANGNGYQDQGEKGLAGVRLATIKGGLIKTDRHGRFHVPCADLPDQEIGSNFILKLDERTLPTGYRLTTENPRVMRLTAGKMVEMNFGAAAGRQVRLDLKDGAFIPGTDQLAKEWEAGLDRLIGILKSEYSYLSVVYRTSQTGEVAGARMKAFRKEVEKRWRAAGSPYDLMIDIQRERR
ncbi:DUF7507 domain-containing protein [Zhengella mangrovi]|nr:SdrD B-like domain-containing protein [Zhengella mangrovi]